VVVPDLAVNFSTSLRAFAMDSSVGLTSLMNCPVWVLKQF
jgi:hypothetical protein